MDKIQLPKGYLSYSAMSAWLSSKDRFRDKYYFGTDSLDTPELRFGKKIAELLENDDPSLAHIPRYSHPEHRFEIDVDGVKIMGFIDSYDQPTNRFCEYKTGHCRPDGSPAWDVIKVRQHTQLPFYSLALELQEGSVDDECSLIWIETKFKKATIEFDGHALEGSTRDLELTGRVETFKRVIKPWERKRMRNFIRTIAEEITEDYRHVCSSGLCVSSPMI